MHSQRHGIIAGVPAADAMFDPVGAVLIIERQGTTPARVRLCTGTLIAPDAVLTAAHCRPEGALHTPATPVLEAEADAVPVPRGLPRPRAPRQTQVAFCLVDAVTSELATASRQPDGPCVTATAFVAHPDYAAPSPWDEGLGQAHDVALLLLQRPLQTPVPAQMLLPPEAAVLVPGSSVAIAGYGRAMALDEAAATAGPLGRKLVANSQLDGLSATEMLVGLPPCRHSKTFGDSGGPSFVQTVGGPRLAGLTSRLAGTEGYAAGTVDTRVDAAAAWVTATLQAACVFGQRASCTLP
jgi:hypothetical protein